ncbi:MAG TPA: DUF4340 domain-containing protein [Vicinamibacterales bacterium]|nr:DUF4340 domain-containing protein [Vicinamibacterales bacterium]
MRGLLSTLALIVVLAGLGGYIYFVDSKRPAGGIEEKQKVFAVDGELIEELTVTSENETSSLRKENGTWRMTAPVTGDADQTAVSSVTSSLAALEINRVIDENAANLAEYGLAEPKIKVAFKAAGGVTGELHLGEKTATQSDVYAVKPGEKRVFLVQAFHEGSFAKKAFDLREKRILNFDRDKVDSVEVTNAGTAIQLARTGSEWGVKQPVQARGDYSAIEALLTRLSSAAMTKIVADPASGAPPAADALAVYGLDQPVSKVTVGAGSSRATLSVGRAVGGELYARDESRGLIFTVDPAIGSDLAKTADEYRDKDLFEFRGFNASTLTIVRGTDTFEFKKLAAAGENAPEKWQRVTAGGSATDVDAAKMEELLTKLTSLRAQSFKVAGAEKPALLISANYDGGKTEQVQIVNTSTEAVAARNGEPGVAVLDPLAYEELVKALDALIAS